MSTFDNIEAGNADNVNILDNEKKTGTKVCPKCGTVVTGKFCSECGLKIENICSQCGAVLDVNVKFCSECGNKVNDNIDDIYTEKTDTNIVTKNNEEEFLAAKLFSIHVNRFNKAGTDTWETLCSTINSAWNEEKYISELSEITKIHKEMAMRDINTNLLQMAFSRIASIVRKDEKVIFYKDTGILSQNGKTGQLVTNKRLYVLNKRNIKYVDYELINSIHKFSISGGWYFNNDPDIQIDSVAISNYELGITLGLICMYARNCHKSSYKINVYEN